MMWNAHRFTSYGGIHMGGMWIPHLGRDEDIHYETCGKLYLNIIRQIFVKTEISNTWFCMLLCHNWPCSMVVTIRKWILHMICTLCVGLCAMFTTLLYKENFIYLLNINLCAQSLPARECHNLCAIFFSAFICVILKM